MPTSSSTQSSHVPPHAAVARVEVAVAPGLPDARAEAARKRALALGFACEDITCAKVYLIESVLAHRELQHVCDQLLADPVVERASLVALPVEPGRITVEVHPLPGVMDPTAQSVRDAIRVLTGEHAEVSTGMRYDIAGVSAAQAREIATRALANPAIHAVHVAEGQAYCPSSLPRGTPYTLRVVTVPLRDASDDTLMDLSARGHLFLTLEEMRAVRAHFLALDRDPTDVELETIAQTWSEHCVHKTLKATVRYREGADASPSLLSRTHSGFSQNHDGTLRIDNLLKRTVAAATHELIARGLDWTLSVFKDNSGVVAFDDDWAVNIKVETHNRPSAIEPYGGAATGIGGCIRDVIGTGLGARPIASTDVFCVASEHASLPPGVLSPRRVLTDVVAGVRDYGNRMGIPTVSGGVFFDDRYVGNPLVFCGCVGLLPRSLVQGQPQAGDRIIALGGRTGRDGIHGATFSSGELQSSSASEFSHAVQIGNAIEEKRLLECILRAREAGRDGTPLYTAMTDCGAGGFSSAIGEMASTLGASVELSHAPVKYEGLSYTEVWISEAQERMVLAVPAANVPLLREIAEREGTLLADLGEFGLRSSAGEAIIRLHYQNTLVGELSCAFLHDGLPNPTREATYVLSSPQGGTGGLPRVDLREALLRLLDHPTIASKHWIIRQYDHEVGGLTVGKPLGGLGGRGPMSAGVLTPVSGSHRGIALAQGLQTPVGEPALGGDAYWMTLASIDECVRNLVCAGADPTRIAILDNFCWPSCDKASNMGALVRACVACYDGALAYGTPFVSGKDSLSNQLRYTDPATGERVLIEIPHTLLITGLGIVPDVARLPGTDAKRAGNMLVLIGPKASIESDSLGASLAQQVLGLSKGLAIPRVDLGAGPAAARCVAGVIARGLAESAHDCSEGGLLVTIAEMLIGASEEGVAPEIGCVLMPDALPAGREAAMCLGEAPSRYVLEVAPSNLHAVQSVCREGGMACVHVGTLTQADGGAGATLQWADTLHTQRVCVIDLVRAWRGTLDW